MISADFLNCRFVGLILVAHTCCDPNRATQCRAHSVAANSRNFRDVAGVSRCTPPTPAKKTLPHLSCHPPCQCGSFYKKNPLNIFFCRPFCNFRKANSPQEFLCNVATAAVSVFGKKHAKEFAL